MAADFLLVPSRDEPFGYTDVEFGFLGVVPVGSLVGGQPLTR
jgi:glycogen synthase